MLEFFLAASLVILALIVQGRIGLDLADEGFLWNGVLRIGQGKIPIRDYKSYDPGRFYWCFGWGKIFGTGIIGIRRSVAVFQMLGLWMGLLAASSAIESPSLLALAGLIMVMWMQPRHKVFEHSISLAAVYLGVVLIESPTAPLLLLTGTFVGLAGFMGRNHGVYCFSGFALLILMLWVDKGTDPLVEHYGVWLIGIVLGYSPMLAMWVFVPDMLRRYWNDKVMVFARRGSANLPLSVPWPWKPGGSRQTMRSRLARFFLGMHFLFLPLLYCSIFAWLVAFGSLAQQPLLASAAVFGVLYMHHAFSRSALPHLSQSMQPFLLAVIALAGALSSDLETFLLLAVFCAIGFVTVRPLVPLMTKLGSPVPFADHDLNGDRISIPQHQADFLSRLEDAISSYVSPGEPLFIAPLTPALYPVLRKETPVRSDFLLFQEIESVQRETIQDLERANVNWALIQDRALDKQDDLRFSKTHAVIWDYLTAQFEPVALNGIDESWMLLSRRSEPSKATATATTIV